ncbi:uncharacterized protein LOC127728150 [Mytilus californianus]|uniref:uncharacterized protein LOC127728150 n=1 Tax=Mytilus californianus TaxID=6549 RepID=UPI0022457709|nr:uncharacterized protein LOC127728150 [Mytilus californianus]
MSTKEIAGIPIFAFVSFILTIVAFVVDLIGFAAPYWYYVKISGTSYYGGIWLNCQSSSETNCNTYVNTETWVEAAQGMEVLGFLCLLAALVTVIVKLFVVKDKPVLKWVVVGCLVVGAVLILIGVCLFAGKSVDVITENLHFAFAFAIIGAMLSIAAAVLLCLDKQST